MIYDMLEPILLIYASLNQRKMTKQRIKIWEFSEISCELKKTYKYRTSPWDLMIMIEPLHASNLSNFGTLRRWRHINDKPCLISRVGISFCFLSNYANYYCVYVGNIKHK